VQGPPGAFSSTGPPDLIVAFPFPVREKEDKGTVMSLENLSFPKKYFLGQERINHFPSETIDRSTDKLFKVVLHCGTN
jgi:hypothetical protein